MKSRSAVIILLGALLAMSIAGSADAQFWKKKSKRKKYRQEQAAASSAADSTKAQPPLTKKEKRKKAKQEHKKLKKENKLKRRHPAAGAKKAIVKPIAAPVKTKSEIIFPPTQFKPRYRIDVLAGLYLDELVKGKYITYSSMPDKAQPGIAFVEGVNIAADSMRKAGYNIDIYVHDAASFQESPDVLVRQGKLDSSDLIIGALPDGLSTLAAFAKKKQIYFISALTDNDGHIKDNQFFTILQPSARMYCDYIADDIAKKYPGKKISLLYRTAIPAENNTYLYLTDSSKKIPFQPLLCNATPGRSQLLSVIDTNGPDVIVIPVLDAVYADSLLKAIARSFPKAHFEIYGMPSWNEMGDLHKAKAFPNFEINVPGPFRYDPASASYVYIERGFRKDYSGKPTEKVYEGYETLLWYAGLLKTYGTIFKYTDNAPAPFTPFRVSPQWNKDNELLYNENSHIFLVRYENGSAKTE